MSADGDFVRSVEYVNYWLHRKIKKQTRKTRCAESQEYLELIDIARRYIELERQSATCWIYGESMPEPEYSEHQGLFDIIHADYQRWNKKKLKREAHKREKSLRELLVSGGGYWTLREVIYFVLTRVYPDGLTTKQVTKAVGRVYPKFAGLTDATVEIALEQEIRVHPLMEVVNTDPIQWRFTDPSRSPFDKD